MELLLVYVPNVNLFIHCQADKHIYPTAQPKYSEIMVCGGEKSVFFSFLKYLL